MKPSDVLLRALADGESACPVPGGCVGYWHIAGRGAVVARRYFDDAKHALEDYSRDVMLVAISAALSDEAGK